ncbi:hypothetical protein M8J76_000574 [Diaphorina citri]|nr:hypothetical protein M8J75_001858 [Diaphorina citri]KAI5748609.1 hypothetical protein M8J76_000574 [Diaphorina citri]
MTEGVDGFRDHDGVKNLAKTPAKLWKDGLIYYEIDKNFSVDRKRFIVKALNNIMTFSCVRFRRRTHNQTPYIVYKESPNGKSCSSNVGFTGKKVSYVNLGKNCFVMGTVQHETLHALGFWHEQARPDRDRFVDIHYELIKKGSEINFKKRNFKEATTLDLPYDFGSIMHYSRFAFSRDSKSPTITPKKTLNVQADKMGQRINISKMDIAKLNTLYKCPNKYYKGRDVRHVKAVQSRPVKIQS